MPTYLFLTEYSTEAMQALLDEGGSGRRDLVKKAVEELGGEMVAFYYAFGEYDAVAIVDLPDNVSATAVSVAVNSAVGARLKTVALLTPAEIDEAARMSVGVGEEGD
jgi:uncharacterized protein with GYD domain